MTRRLYYTDSYLKELQADVRSVSDDGLRVVLDETVFYPTSGGQPHDLGKLNGVQVMDVVDDGDDIIHVLADAFSGNSAHAEIDWDRRYDHMQQHTGQHLLSAVFEELFDIGTLSFRMGERASTIELDIKELTLVQTDSVVLRATELARANPPIEISFEEAARAEGLRKASEREGSLRIIEIGHNIDRSACGGTHVASLAEVLPVQIREVDKVRGNVRVSFVCGTRALARIQSDFQILSRLAKSVSTSIENMEVQVAGLQKRVADAEKQRKRLENEAATRAGLDLYAATAPREDGTRSVFISETVLDESARLKAKAFSSQSKALILLKNLSDILLGCSADSGVNAQQALAQAGVRGGGSATMAQGSVPDLSSLNALKQLLEIT